MHRQLLRLKGLARLPSFRHQIHNRPDEQDLLSQVQSQPLQQKESLASISALDSKGMLCVNGLDSFKILQGVFSNDLNQFRLSPARKALHGAFLNEQGRVVADALILRPQVVSPLSSCPVSKEREFWVQVDRSQLVSVRRHLKKFSMRRKVQVSDISEQVRQVAVFSHYLVEKEEELGQSSSLFVDQDDTSNGVAFSSHNDTDVFFDKNLSYTDLNFIDPRNVLLGKQFITAREPEGEQNSMAALLAQLEVKDEESFRHFKMMVGVAEGQVIEGMLPFQANLDFMDSLSYNKGCYLGQEIVARAYHTGIIRKRLLPYILLEEDCQHKDVVNQEDVEWLLQAGHDQSFPTDQVEIKDAKGKVVGKSVMQRGALGLALVDYFKVEANHQALTRGPFQCKIVFNEWLQQRIDTYKDYVQKKVLKQ